jgi:hypothetical protein
VNRVGPPWHLQGSGSILLFRFEPGFLEHSFLEHSLGLVMLVDYDESPVGPYWELLFLSGFRTITRIYVSTEESAVNGRENWGIPKEVADFAVERRGRTEHVHVTLDGRTVADLTVGIGRPPLPVTATVLPRSWRTLAQPWEGRTLVTTLAGRGVIRPARLLKARIDPDLFPDLTRGRILGAVHASRFRLIFPEPKVID